MDRESSPEEGEILEEGELEPEPNPKSPKSPPFKARARLSGIGVSNVSWGTSFTRVASPLFSTRMQGEVGRLLKHMAPSLVGCLSLRFVAM